MVSGNDSIPISPIALIEQNSPERTGYENEFGGQGGDKSWVATKGVGWYTEGEIEFE